eukprot:GDKI01048325.1.p1 GENE.GDKI01048325.1~~GDKI01048325.1.p1  ORF type:complete len:529 (-),score=146.87 GDKI01048325.1:40-1626(-)
MCRFSWSCEKSMMRARARKRHARQKRVGRRHQMCVCVRGKEVPLVAYQVKDYEKLYLLEPKNEEDRWISRRLYQGGEEDRIAQEIVLGVGGVRLLRALHTHVDIYHFNEGHAVLAGLELIREKMTDTTYTQGTRDSVFQAAWEATRRQIVFTTHTPVPAGNEYHSVDLIHSMDGGCGLTHAELLMIGGKAGQTDALISAKKAPKAETASPKKPSPEEIASPSPLETRQFGMTEAGLRLAYIANGVAELHGETARKMWKDVDKACPIVHVTNGVHTHTWMDERIRDAYEGKGSQNIYDAHMCAKHELLDEIETRTDKRLSPDALTIGFARRAVTYKRSTLIFTYESEIAPLLQTGKLQLVFSGKAHPQDVSGKAIVQQLKSFEKKYPQGVVYLENYDMTLGALLTRGCDVWLNTPERPKEASGTSGMKAAMNAVLNLSILDGWWPEGCEHGVTGWRIGNPEEGEGADEKDARALTDVLTKEVLPTFNDRQKWSEMMHNSIRVCKDKFSSERMVMEYYSKVYAHQPDTKH